MPKKARAVLDLEKLEIEAAASIMIYDKQELQEFMNFYTGTVSENDLGISGVFAKFLEIINNALKDGIFDDESETEREELGEGIVRKSTTMQDRLEKYVLKSASVIPSSDEREKFIQWLSLVLNDEAPVNLAEDVIHHYLWENYKMRLDRIDKSDASFIEKIQSIPRPMEIQDTESNILTLDQIDVSEDNESNRLYTTGIDAMDEYVQAPGTALMIIAARPGVGKTLMMLQQCVENARGGKYMGSDQIKLKPKKSLFISLEMSLKSVHDRIFGYLSGENLKELTKTEYQKRIKELKEDENNINVIKNLHILATTSSNGEQILSDIEKMVDEHGIECVFLDYLQLLKFTGKDEWGSIREATNSLKNLAFKKNILICTGSQVSRASTQEGLSLTDLFGGSSIEADADIVLGMEALRDRKSSSNTNAVSLKVLKNREGAVTTIKTDIDYSCGWITPKESAY